MSEKNSSALHIPSAAIHAMAAHSYACFPEEACGLLVGDRIANTVARFVPITNTAHSAKFYTIDPKEHLRAEIAAEAEGFDIIGCVHSHTHTEPYPSPTDVAQAPDPEWHYIIVGLSTREPVARAYRIVNEQIAEEAIVTI